MQTLKAVLVALALVAVTLAGQTSDKSDVVGINPKNGKVVSGEATAVAPVTNNVVSSTDAVTIPQMMSYQGRLTDASGEPVADGNYSVAFWLYTEPTGGSPFWTETQSVTTRDGLFSVLLGSATPIGSVPNADAAYIGMAVEGSEEMTPRLRIAGTYASPREKVGTNYVPPGGTDADYWDLMYPDVLGTVARGTSWYGVAKGNASNTLYGSFRYSHTNLGCYSQTGASGSNYINCTVSGGKTNIASNNYATVGGGYTNTASGSSSTVGGGSTNTASNTSAVVSGGYTNTASGNRAVVGGGGNNRASGEHAVVDGGYQNTASGNYATVGGGEYNVASGVEATVAGGTSDTASNTNTTVGGGYSNKASGQNATVAGGYDNTASYIGATVGGGSYNTSSYNYATVSGGMYNTASNVSAVIGGGYSNTASGLRSVIGGGFTNIASGEHSQVGGGYYNTASGNYAHVGGGQYNRAAGQYSAILGGAYDTVMAPYSVVFGNNVYAYSSDTCVVFFDTMTHGVLRINLDGRQNGGPFSTRPIHVGTSPHNGNLAYLSAGGVWTSGFMDGTAFDRQPVDAGQLLARVKELNVTRLRAPESGEEHITPTVGDFYSAFECGTAPTGPKDGGTGIAAIDVAGVSLVAVQELLRRLEVEQAKVAELEARLAKLEQR